jgi:hypothetical protein
MPTESMIRELGLSGEPVRENCKKCGQAIDRYGKYTFNSMDYKRSPGAVHMFSCGESDQDETGGGELPPIPDQGMNL